MRSGEIRRLTNAAGLAGILLAAIGACAPGAMIPHSRLPAAGSPPSLAAIPEVTGMPDVVTVVPFVELPHPTAAERLQVMISADVDGHRGNFLVDLGDPDLDLNRAYLQPSPTGGVDTVVDQHRLPTSTVNTDDPSRWEKVHVVMRIGTLRVDPDDPDINSAQQPHRFNATLNDMHAGFGQSTSGYFLVPRLGDIGLCVLRPFETIIDFRHRRLVLIRLDHAGHRLAVVPGYTPRWTAPLVDIARDADYYGVQHWWGLAVRPDRTLDTLAPAANTVVRQVSTLPWAYEGSPQAITWGDLGYPFLRQFGVVGFNARTHQFILYR